MTDEEFIQLKEKYGNNLDEIRIKISLEELRNLIISVSGKNITIDNDILFKIAIEQIIEIRQRKKLENCKNEIVPLSVIRYNLEIRALKKANGDITKASSLLGISERTLYRDINIYGINIKSLKER
jgi:transcriptional regulator with PAS, ATPase and Fis domain